MPHRAPALVRWPRHAMPPPLAPLQPGQRLHGSVPWTMQASGVSAPTSMKSHEHVYLESGMHIPLYHQYNDRAGRTGDTSPACRI